VKVLKTYREVVLSQPYDCMNSHSTDNNSQITISLFNRIVANKSNYHTGIQTYTPSNDGYAFINKFVFTDVSK
jgi:hypothetical protein